jgi:acetolactate synthase-1/3 small subunit
LTVGATENPRFSRMTIVLNVDKDLVRQIESQLQKLVTVVETVNLSHTEHVERDLALVRVETKEGRRTEILEIVEIFRAQVVDVAPKSLLIEISGEAAKIDAFIKALAPYKIVGLTRSGCIAAPRGDVKSVATEE